MGTSIWVRNLRVINQYAGYRADSLDRLPAGIKCLVEYFSDQPKSVLKSHENPDWCETLLTVLLGNETCLKADIRCSSKETAFGTILLVASLRHEFLIHWLYRHMEPACIFTCKVFLRHTVIHSDDRYSFRPISKLVRMYTYRCRFDTQTDLLISSTSVSFHIAAN